MGSLFWTAFALGVAYCAPPGALTVEALRRGLRRGFIGAFLTELGSLVGDAAWAALALSGVAYLVAYRPVSMLLAVLGVVLLFALALNALRDAWVGGLPRARYMSARGDLIAGACISLSNPYAIAFWLGLGGTISGLVPIRLGRPALVVFFAAFMLAAVVWCFFISAMIAWGRRFMHATFYRWVNVACGGVLIYFGVRLLITLLEHPGAFTSR